MNKKVNNVDLNLNEKEEKISEISRTVVTTCVFEILIYIKEGKVGYTMGIL